MKSGNAKTSLSRVRGFTLIELLLACAVFAVLAGALYGVFSTALRLREKGQGNFERGANEEAAMEIMRRDLTCMMIPAGTLAGPMLGQAGSKEIDSDSLEFYTASGIVTGDKPWGDVQKVNYILADSETVDPSSGGHDLVREVTRNLLSGTETGTGTEPEQQRILDDVESLHFQYLGADGLVWEDSWDSAANDNTPPAAVKVQVSFIAPSDNASSRQPLEMVYELPVRTTDTSTSETTDSSSGAATP